MPNDLCFADVTLFHHCYFLTTPLDLETNYLNMYWTDLHKIVSICTYMGGHGQSDLLFASSGDVGSL